MSVEEILATLLQKGSVTLQITIKLDDTSVSMIHEMRGASHKRLPDQESFPVSCPHCTWSAIKTSATSASKALKSHQNHCTGYARDELDLSWIAAMNGGTIIQD